jgi:DNA-binding NtrC family response regulator
MVDSVKMSTPVIMNGFAGHFGAISKAARGSTTDLFLLFRATVPEMMIPNPTFPRGEGQRIMLVDDEVDILDLLEMFLSVNGYAVEAFTSSPLALARMEACPSGFDIVLTDLTIPILTGLELAKRIRKLRPDLPVLLITGHRKALESCGELPTAVCEVLLKPFDLACMAQSIAQHLRRSGH